jgi:hypothetical protein
MRVLGLCGCAVVQARDKARGRESPGLVASIRG